MIAKIDFEGYYSLNTAQNINLEEGIFCVYAGIMGSQNLISLTRLLDIVETETIQLAILKESNIQNWAAGTNQDEILAFSISSGLSVADRRKFIKPLLIMSTPALNRRYAGRYLNSLQGLIHTTGDNYGLPI